MLLTAVNNGYWTDIIATIATSAAVIIALINTAYTMNKDRKNKKDYNDKTLYMLNLKTEEYRMEFSRYHSEIKTTDFKTFLYNSLNDNLYNDISFTGVQKPDYTNDIENIKELIRKLDTLKHDKVMSHSIKYRGILQETLYNYYTSLTLENIKAIELAITLSKSLEYNLNLIRMFPKKEVLNTNTPFNNDRLFRIHIGLSTFETFENILYQLSKRVETIPIVHKAIETDNKEDNYI